MSYGFRLLSHSLSVCLTCELRHVLGCILLNRIDGGTPIMPDIMADSPLNDAQFVKENGFHVFSDGSFGSVSYGGFVLMYMNGPIAWGSRKIKVQVTSSAGAPRVVNPRATFVCFWLVGGHR